MSLPSQAKLREDFTYDPESGDFVLYDGKWGWINKRGYIEIRYEQKTHLVHRLIWKWYHGYDPDTIDHINGDRLDNGIKNLRSVEHKINCKNQKKRINNTSGFTGVYWYAQSNKWRAEVNIEKQIYVGSYDTPQEAANARHEFINKFYPDLFTDRHGT